MERVFAPWWSFPWLNKKLIFEKKKKKILRQTFEAQPNLIPSHLSEPTRYQHQANIENVRGQWLQGITNF